MMRYFSILFAMSVGLVACDSGSSSSGTANTIIGGNPVDGGGSCVVSDQVIEDDVTVGGNCGVYEGTVVREKAVLGAGVILTRGTPVYDLVRETVHRGTAERPLEIPAGAVVVPGARAVKHGFGAAEGLSLQTPIIVKYRDERTDLATALEGWLR